MYQYNGKVVRVIDGDTIEVLIDLGFEVHIFQTLRLNRIDAYETSLRGGTTEEQKLLGIAGKEFLKSILPRDTKVVIKTEKSDKYDRYLADVTINENEHELNINELMVSKGFAVYKTY